MDEPIETAPSRRDASSGPNDPEPDARDRASDPAPEPPALPDSFADLLRGAGAVFLKDLRLELRNRYAINTLFLFVASLLLLILFALGPGEIPPRIQSALIWIIILFSAAVGLGRAFVFEQEQGTVLFLRLNTRPEMVYLGKLLFNALLIGTVNFGAVGAYWVLFNLTVPSTGLLVATLVLGSIGLAGATTLLSAIIARTANQGPLFAVLAFPILVPLLLTVVGLTRSALLGGAWNTAGQELLSLIGYAGVVITGSLLLFDFVWED